MASLSDERPYIDGYQGAFSAMSRQLVNQVSYKNKVARRIFAVFIVCSLIPLLTISAASFFYVSSQLRSQAYERLHQYCKSQGFSIYEHLVFLENELAHVAYEFNTGNIENAARQPFNPISREGSGFRRIFRLFPDGRTVSILAFFKDLCPIAVKPLLQLDTKRTLMACRKSGDKFPPLYLRRLLNPMKPEDGYIVGEIDPIFLFGIGTQGALPPEMNMEIRQLDGELLISSFLGINYSREFKENYDRSPMTGKYESVYNQKQYINSYWSLFLNHRFGSPDWIVILSQPKAIVLSPLTRFALIFILMILLTLFSIMLFSMRAIRKRMIPVGILQDGAMRIAKGEFGYQVAIASGDEFEALSSTFNEMSNKLKQGQSMLMQAAKMSAFGQMGAGIVHEIGQPLSAISGYAELLQMGMAPDKHRRYLETICSETQRLAKIISKFRVFSRSSRDVAELLNLNEVIDNVNDLLGHNLTIKQVRLELLKDERLPSISGDKDALRQVLLNLIINARDALEEKPAEDRLIKIESYAGGGMVNVTVSDNGCGIPPEIQQSIFDPFYTTKSEDKGTGLGLAVISSIIHKHNGKIELESVVHKGSRFTVSFPEAILAESTGEPAPR
jgi:signal transduction histidine kinase